MSKADEFDGWSKEDLIEHIRKLKPVAGKKKAERPQLKPFLFHTKPRRKIALLFCYAGWNYSGLAIQATPTALPTVEEVLIAALRKARLIHETDSLDVCEFSRCGRTDKGVSAAGQVISLYVRSSLGIGQEAGVIAGLEQIAEADAERKTCKEINFVHSLNSILPSSIRILAWSPVLPTFDARFSCQARHYKYSFCTATLPLNIGLMMQAAIKLIGEHDFRNFCKVDPSKQLPHHIRKVLTVSIEKESEHWYTFNLRGTAFLWHQIRCIMAILFLVGHGLETPDVVTALLDVERFPGKPQYDLASPLPLSLYRCEYLPDAVVWQAEPSTSSKVRQNISASYQMEYIKASTWAQFASPLEWRANSSNSLGYCQTGGGEHVGVTPQTYRSVLKREVGPDPQISNIKYAEGKGKKRSRQAD